VFAAVKVRAKVNSHQVTGNRQKATGGDRDGQKPKTATVPSASLAIDGGDGENPIPKWQGAIGYQML